MNQDKKGNIVQVFPIGKSTVAEIAVDRPAKRKVVRMLADENITFTFDDDSTFALANALAGMDFACSEEVKSVSSSVMILVS